MPIHDYCHNPEDGGTMHMSESLTTFLPRDRCYAIARNIALADRTSGAALFADISGFTQLTESLSQTLGPKRGAEEVTRQLNRVYEALIPEIHHYGGSVISFSGDAIICWFDGDDGLRATACALALQKIIAEFVNLTPIAGVVVALAIKAAIAAGPVRRLLVGDPQIQVMDVIAGATLDRVSLAEKQAGKGEVIVTADTLARLEGKVEVVGWRYDAETDAHFAVVSRVLGRVDAGSWPQIDLQATTANLDVHSWTSAPRL